MEGNLCILSYQLAFELTETPLDPHPALFSGDISHYSFLRQWGRALKTVAATGKFWPMVA